MMPLKTGFEVLSEIRAGKNQDVKKSLLLLHII